MCGSVRYRDAETTHCPCLPLVTPLPPNCITQPLQNLHIEMTSTLSRRYELTVHQIVHFKEFRELFVCLSYTVLEYFIDATLRFYVFWINNFQCSIIYLQINGRGQLKKVVIS
jgi:hypothetical protein